MPTPTPPATGTTPEPPAIPTGREIYDAIMAHIEPELTSEGCKKLAETYAHETPDEKIARMDRYALAFERCEVAYQEYMQTIDVQMNRYRREAFVHAETDDRARDDGILDQLSTLLSQPTP